MGDPSFTLYVAGGTELAARALANFDRTIRPRIAGSCALTIIDIRKEPRKAREHRVVATPMLVRNHPLPVIKILGDLSQEDVIVAQLGLRRFETDGSLPKEIS
ncbi:circadian clock KaiB family protein [Planctomyces sp. SH-PL14]|uniref:circadian clock KaiB family protein n=1 Tax=Planctomyces sp. SH-PL14 TaxID=1632864 RepID=UPI00078C08B5|nr:circadian clock KaiB family protein [Planctomyces sp. SH-PL14]AMV22447.1 Circadian clock protein KaiB [Planctomyces sp. SH-PL14]